MLPPLPDSEEPATRARWPSNGHEETVTQATVPSETITAEGRFSATGVSRPEGTEVANARMPGKKKLSTWNLITLSISMAGAQIAWTVELG